MAESVFKTNMVYIYLFFKGIFMKEMNINEEIKKIVNELYKIKFNIEEIIIELEKTKEGN